MITRLIFDIVLFGMIFRFFLKGDIILNLIFIPFILALISEIVLIIAKIKHLKIDKKLFRKIYEFGVSLFYILLAINAMFLGIKDEKFYVIIIVLPIIFLMLFSINEELLEKPIIKIKDANFFKNLPLILGIIVVYIIILIIVT